jgi:ABC-type lipoprotein release transport system permease subunit
VQIASRYLYAGRLSGTRRRRAVVAGGHRRPRHPGWLGSGPAIGVIMFVFGLLSMAVFSLLSFLSVPTSVAVFGVSLGTAALTVVLSHQRLQDLPATGPGVNAHVIIMKSSTDFASTARPGPPARSTATIAVQPFIFVEMLATTGKGRIAGVAIKGVDPDGWAARSRST